MQCPQCEAENPPDAASCRDCGQELSGALRQAETLATPTEADPSVAPAADEERVAPDAMSAADEGGDRKILFGRYEVIAELGRGGMGRVLRVLDREVNEEVALKLIAPEFAASEQHLERFRNELKLARKIAHRNVCHMFDLNEADGTHFITMELVRGEELRRLQKRTGKLPTERLAEIARGVCRGLAEAHRLGVVHRDLKPGNIMIDEAGEPRIMDFGIARSAATAGLTKLGTMIGTPHYMSPEQVAGAEADTRSDIYSLGVILFEMAVGRLPFEGDTALAIALKHKSEPPPDPRSLDSDVPPKLSWIITKCLEKEPDDRFQDVREILNELGWTGQEQGERSIMLTSELPAFLGGEVEEPTEDFAFAAREAEMEALGAALESALAAQGRVVFITGEPGSGKTSLATEFARRAQQQESQLVVSMGRCDAHTGAGDPYHPFRQALELLTGDIEAYRGAGFMTQDAVSRLWALVPKSAAAVVDHGPILLETLLPSGPLVARAEAAAGEAPEWLARLRILANRVATSPPSSVKEAQLLEQYSRVLIDLARHRPLLLLLDDLHWVDSRSGALLFHLGRRIRHSRILVVGTYRATDLALGRNGDRHPLEPIVNELKRDFGQIEISLEKAEGRHFLDAYLDTEPNRFGKEFRDALYRQTMGHPLFTVELLRSMQDQGMVDRDEEGNWVESGQLSWEALPDRTEGVIGERIGRVPEDLRELLSLASVEGQGFTAEVIARIKGSDGRRIVKLLSGQLDKRHRLVKAEGIRRVNGARLSTYSFRHVLFQRYLYGQLDEAERSYLHEEIGQALESLYGERHADVAVELAQHYEIAGNTDKAAHYRSLAGKMALRLSAFHEAVNHQKKGLSLLASLPPSDKRRQQELDLRLALASGQIAAEGYGSTGLEQNYAEIRRLCDKPAESPHGIQILYRLWGFHFIRGHREEAFELADQLGAVAGRTGDPTHRSTADNARGIMIFYGGDFERANQLFQQAAGRFDAEGYEARVMMYGADPLFDAWFYQAWSCLLCGRLEESWSSLTDALAAAERLGAPYAVAEALCFSAGLAWDAGRDLKVTEEAARRCVTLSQEHGFPFWLAHGSVWLGLASVIRNRTAEGLEDIQNGLALLDAIGAVVPNSATLVHLAEAHQALGQVAEGLVVVDRALELSSGGLERFCEAEAHRLRGELLLLRGGDPQAPEESFREALKVARAQKSVLRELRAATSLGRLLRDQGRAAEVREVLQHVYDQLPKGHESRHVRVAGQLLEELN